MYLKDLTGKTVLDIGCGSGGITAALARDFGATKVISIDVEEPVCRHARHTAAVVSDYRPQLKSFHRLYGVDLFQIFLFFSYSTAPSWQPSTRLGLGACTFPIWKTVV